MKLLAIILCCVIHAALVHSAVNLDTNKIETTKSACHDFIAPISYPAAQRNETIIDTYHGVQVADPYRWLEDPDLDETKRFIDAENELTELYLNHCDEWSKINQKLTAVWNYAKYSVPRRHGKHYFSKMNTGLQNQGVLYKQLTLDDEPVVLLDPNKLSDDGTVALTNLYFSENGNLMAYSLSKSGSEWSKIKIRNVETGEDYPETLTGLKYTYVAWTHDNNGFFYVRFPSEGVDNIENQKVYYHRVGEPQEKDALMIEFPKNPSWRIEFPISTALTLPSNG